MIRRESAWWYNVNVCLLCSISVIILEYIGDIDDLRKYHREIGTKYVSPRDTEETRIPPQEPELQWPNEQVCVDTRAAARFIPFRLSCSDSCSLPYNPESL